MRDGFYPHLQFHEFTFDSSPSFPLDKNAYSGRDQGTREFEPKDEYSPEELEKLNRDTLIEAAKQAFAQYVLEPLGLFSKFIGFTWEYGVSVPVIQIRGGVYNVDVEVTVSETVNTASEWDGTINVSVDKAGNLTAETSSAISGSSAAFEIEDIGNNLDYERCLKSIAASVKEGTISYRVVPTNANEFAVELMVESENLAPQGSGVEAFMNVVVTYKLAPGGTGSGLQKVLGNGCLYGGSRWCLRCMSCRTF